jgi:hypothetical protein
MSYYYFSDPFPHLQFLSYPPHLDFNPDPPPIVQYYQQPLPTSQYSYTLTYPDSPPTTTPSITMDPPPTTTNNDPTGNTTPNNNANTAKKPRLACLFCRERKIACGPPPPSCADKTCRSVYISIIAKTHSLTFLSQCFRRKRKCEYPLESRRGMRKKKSSALSAPKLVIRTTPSAISTRRRTTINGGVTVGNLLVFVSTALNRIVICYRMGKPLPDSIFNKDSATRRGLELRRGPDPRSFHAGIAGIAATSRTMMGLEM